MQEVVLAGLEPLKGLGTGPLTSRTGQPLEMSLREFATELERFLDRAMPVAEAVDDPCARAGEWFFPAEAEREHAA